MFPIFSLDPIFEQRGISSRALDVSEARQLSQAWLSAFCPLVKETTGKWIKDGFRWHAYSFEIQPCRHGLKALDAYRSQVAEPFFVFDEPCRSAYECTASELPDFSDYSDEVYVCAHDFQWSMAFTHEQPDLGPYFAVRGGT